MKRTVEGTRSLPAFLISIGDLEVLMEKILDLFGETNPYTSISIELKGEKLDFKTVEEMTDLPDLPDRVTSFSIYVSQDNIRKIHLRSVGTFGSSGYLSVTSDNESWCAGAIEVVYQFIQKHRRWHSWFRDWPLGALFLISFNIESITEFAGFKSMTNNPLFQISWVSSIVVIGSIYFSRNRFFPAGTLQVRPYDNWFRKYQSEITLIVAIIGVVLGFLNLFLKKQS